MVVVDQDQLPIDSLRDCSADLLDQRDKSGVRAVDRNNYRKNRKFCIHRGASPVRLDTAVVPPVGRTAPALPEPGVIAEEFLGSLGKLNHQIIAQPAAVIEESLSL